MREEGHHHLLLANQYVNVFFVEIPPHETTLLHHHDFPYISLPPGGAYVELGPAEGPGAPPGPNVERVSYAEGNFSHAVTNSSDVTLQNIAVELVRPQGMVRNRCAAVLRDQPRETCDTPKLTAETRWRRSPLLETDEILVELWELSSGTRTPPVVDRLDMLIGGLTGVSITAKSEADSGDAVRSGLIWLPAGSKPVFKTNVDRGTQFVTISFKDSAPASR
jgi:hypothetical protein